MVACAVGVAPACGHNSGSGPGSVLDGRPRLPSVEGVATSAGRDGVTVAGRRFAVDPRLESFSPYDGGPVPLVSWRGQYVQAGVRKGRVVWISGFGPPLGAPATITFTGRTTGVVDGRLRFAGGVTLRVAHGLQAPPAGAKVQAVVYVNRREVVSYTVLSGGSR